MLQEIVISETYSKLIAYLVRRGASEQDAQDIAQETCIRFLESGKSSVKLLFRMLSCQRAEFYRRAMRERKRLSVRADILLHSVPRDGQACREGAELFEYDPELQELFYASNLSSTDRTRKQRKISKIRETYPAA